MKLVNKRDESDHRRMEQDVATEAEETETIQDNADENEIEEDVDSKETESQQEIEVVTNISNNEIPPKPDDFVEPDQTLQESKIEVTFPPQATKAPAPTDTPKAVPLPAEKVPLDSNSNATMTGLAKQELGNWLSGGPQKQGDENEDEMDAPIPPDDEDSMEDIVDVVDDDSGGMDIPQTQEEEDQVNEAIEEWEEENGKPKPDADVEVEEEEEVVVAEDSGSSKDDIPMEEKDSTDSGEIIDTETSTSVPEGSETKNPLVVSPSWTPPKVQPKHTFKPREPTPPPVQPQETRAPEPTLAPVPMPTPTAFVSPTSGNIVINQNEDQDCQEYGLQSTSYLLCKNNIPPMAGSIVGVGVPLLIILCCCWKYCCGSSKKETNSRGEYRQIANTYGDASFNNAFSEDISDDEDDLEDASWGESNGRRVLEMRNMGQRRGDDDLSLEEMNG